MKTLRSLQAVLLVMVLSLTALAKIGVEQQMLLGNASSASNDAGNHSHYLIKRAQYALDYADVLGVPNWVSWNLTTDDLGDSGRSSSFYADTTLPSGFWIVGTSDYSGSGYDRGHMCPSADRTITTADNKVLFYMTNMVPQHPDNNQGVWATFENYCRTLAKAGNELLITSGPGGFNSTTIASGVAVPGYVWKVVVVVPSGTTDVTTRINADTRVIALKIPNVAMSRTVAWSSYVVSVAELEIATGLQFFTALTPELAATLKAKKDSGASTGGSTDTAPTISTQPSSQSLGVGASTTLKVVATGSGTLSYQWMKDGVDIPGATSSTLVLSNASSSTAGSYSVTVTNDIGSITSNAAVISVSVIVSGSLSWDFTTAALTSASPANLSVGEVLQKNCYGTTALISTESKSSGYTGASGSNNACNVAIIGALNKAEGSGSAYFEVTLTPAAGFYLTLTSMSFGSRSTATGPMMVSVFSSLDAYATAIGSGIVPANKAWVLVNPGLTATTITPGTPVTLRIYGHGNTGASSPSKSTANWRIDDLNIGATVASAAPDVLAAPTDLIAHVGGAASFTVTASGYGSLTYQWRKNGELITGNSSAQTKTLVLSNLSASDIASYDVVVTNGYGSQTSAAASLSVLQTYEAWALTQGLNATQSADQQDPDGDGVPNLIEYFLGMNPLLEDLQKLPTCSLVDGSAKFSFLRSKTAYGADLAIETSTDLNTWTQLAPTVTKATDNADDYQVLIAAETLKRFFRVKLGTLATKPVGYQTLKLNGAGATNIVALSLDDLQAPLSGLRAGRIELMDTLTVHNSLGSWTPGALANTAAPWQLRITTGVAAGKVFDIKSNTATSITLSGTSGLALLGVVAGQDCFELVPVETLGTLFGSTTLQGASTVAAADTVSLRSGSTWLSYYYDTGFGHWRRTIGAATNCDNIVVRQFSGIMIQRKGGDLTQAYTGRVLGTNFRQSINNAGSTVTNLGFPQDLTLASAALQGLFSNWRATSSDQVYLFESASWKAYYYNGTNWVSSTGANADSTTIEGGKPVMFQRAGTTAGTTEIIRNVSF